MLCPRLVTVPPFVNTRLTCKECHCNTFLKLLGAVPCCALDIWTWDSCEWRSKNVTTSQCSCSFALIWFTPTHMLTMLTTTKSHLQSHFPCIWALSGTAQGAQKLMLITQAAGQTTLTRASETQKQISLQCDKCLARKWENNSTLPRLWESLGLDSDEATCTCIVEATKNEPSSAADLVQLIPMVQRVW